MRTLIAGLALGALLAGGAAAQAATSIDTPGFTITYVDGWYPGYWNIGLDSTFPGGASISLGTLDDDLSPQFGAWDEQGGGTQNGNYHWSVLRIDVHAGYRVAGVSLSGTARGVLDVGEVAGFPPGSATNRTGIQWGMTAGGEYTAFDPVGYVDITGEHAFTQDSGASTFASSFEITLNGAVFGEAFGAAWNGQTDPSYAMASIGGALLNVQVAPVPEPGTYAMLLGGLGVLATAARRRRRI